MFQNGSAVKCSGTLHYADSNIMHADNRDQDKKDCLGMCREQLI